MFRIGKPLDSLQMILKSLSIKDEFIKTTTILKATGYGGWLVLDMLQWVKGAIYSLLKCSAVALSKSLRSLQPNSRHQQVRTTPVVVGNPGQSSQ